MSLFYYCKRGDLAKIKSLIESRTDVTVDYNQVVGWASEKGHLDMVKYLVENGADVTADDNLAIGWASEKGHLEVVKYLVENGADVTADDNSAVRRASRNGHLEVVKYLVENGADVTAYNNETIRYACLKSYFKLFKYLLNETIIDITVGDDFGFKIPFRYGNIENIKYLVKNIGDVKANDWWVAREANKYDRGDIIEYVNYLFNKSKYIKLLNKRFRVINKDLIKMIS